MSKGPVVVPEAREPEAPRSEAPGLSRVEDDDVGQRVAERLPRHRQDRRRRKELDCRVEGFGTCVEIRFTARSS